VIRTVFFRQHVEQVGELVVGENAADAFPR
jgi:hypothetical protein